MCCAAATVFVIGCQVTPNGAQLTPTTPDADEEMLTERERQELAEIREMLTHLGPNVSSDLRALKDMLERQQQQLEAKAGPPDLVKDLWPTQRVLNETIQTAQQKKGDETLASIDRLQKLVATVEAGLPAREIMVRCERALAYLAQDALDRAYAELGLAYDTADRSPFPRLVPSGVASLIQTSARNQIAAGRAQEAASVVDTVRRNASQHDSLAKFNRINAGLEGARTAGHREAWSVVEAELYEVHNQITALAETLRIDQWEIAPRPDDDEEPAELPEVDDQDAAESDDVDASPEPETETEVEPEADEDDDEIADGPAEAGPRFRRPVR